LNRAVIRNCPTRWTCRALSDTNVILNHCGGLLGIAPHENRKYSAWRENMRNRAVSNLTVKVGGLG
jgi:predicted TIM-barrel fold metal-dependent hydrolase